MFDKKIFKETFILEKKLLKFKKNYKLFKNNKELF